MKKTNIIGVILGAAVGAVASWYFTKNYCEKKADEEIKSVKDIFCKNKEKEPVQYTMVPSSEKEEPVKTRKELMEEAISVRNTNKPPLEEYVNRVKNYNSLYNSSKSVEERVHKAIDKLDKVEDVVTNVFDEPVETYVISPDEFGEDDYGKISLTYYQDGFVANELMELVNVDSVFGFDIHDHFGEYEDDSVFVRNDRLKVDYEVLYDERKYTDVLQTVPHRNEGYEWEEEI